MLVLARRHVPALRPDFVLFQHSPWLPERSRRRDASSFLDSLQTACFENTPEGIELRGPAFRPIVFDLPLDEYLRSPRGVADFLGFECRVGIPLLVHDDFARALVRLREGPLEPPSVAEETAYVHEEVARLCAESGSKLVVVLVGKSSRPVALDATGPHRPWLVVDAVAALSAQLPPDAGDAGPGRLPRALRPLGRRPAAPRGRSPEPLGALDHRGGDRRGDRGAQRGSESLGSQARTEEPPMIAVGRAAPAFDLPDQDGKRRKLGEFRGQWLVLYFYPRDDTPGCTVEACEFTGGVRAFGKLDAVVLGCSPDTPEQHRKFIAKHNLEDRPSLRSRARGDVGVRRVGRQGAVRAEVRGRHPLDGDRRSEGERRAPLEEGEGEGARGVGAEKARGAAGVGSGEARTEVGPRRAR
jgi:hypothetical protein